MTLIAPTLQMFFTDRRAQQRQASPRTVAVRCVKDLTHLTLGLKGDSTPVVAAAERHMFSVVEPG